MERTTRRHTSICCYLIKLKFLLSLLVLCSAANAAKIKEIQTIEGISEYSLDNGLQILLFPDESKDTITVNITYQVGSKHENYGETGMAHLLEHLLFKGSKKHKNITKEMTDHGAQANGTTWYERTNYYETFKATEENLNWALSMEADRMVNSFVAQKDLDSEMTVVRNEFERGENSPVQILIQRIYSSAFDWHNYGNSTIGARSDIENVKIENLRNFYKKYYQPDNATLTIAGKIDKDKTLKLVKKYFGKIKKPSRTLPEFYTVDQVQDGERSITLRRVGGEQVVAAAYKIPSGIHEDFAALDILSSILGDSPTGRLHKNLTEKQLATVTWAWPNQQKEPGLLYFNATVDANTDIEKSTSALLETLENIAQKPITNKEVERAKRKTLKQIELAFNDSQKISINLSEWIGIGDWRMLFINRDRIEKVTAEDVQRVAKKYLISSNRTLGQFLPTKEPERAIITQAPNIEELVEGYKGKKVISQGEAFDATLENISKREIRNKQGGIKISAVPIKTRGESVFINIRVGLGNENSLQNKSSVHELTAAMLLRGNKRLSREDLQDEFDSLKAQGGIGHNAQSITASYETTRENLPKVIALIHEVLTTASFPEKEFNLLKAQKLSKLSSDSTDPQALAFNKLLSNLNTYPVGHMYHAETFDEYRQALESTTLEDVKSFYKENFGSMNIQVGVAGDFDYKNINQQIFDQFSDWKSQIKYKREKELFQDVELFNEKIETPDKKNSFFVAARNLDLTHKHEDAPALYVITRMLGGGFLNSRLASRIRQKDGLSYGVGAFLRLDRFNENGRFFAYAISAPQNTEKVEKAFKEEMQRAYDEGFTQQELSSSIEGLLDQAKITRSDNRVLAQTLRSFYNDEFTFIQEKEIQDKIRQLTVEDVNRVMRKYLSPKTMSIVKAGDFASLKE